MNPTEFAIHQIARAAIREHVLAGWSFEFTNAKTQAGLCNYRKRTIYLSRVFIKNADDHQIRMVILHEVAHAIVGHRAGHGPVWQRKCLEIGGDGQRCYNDGGAARKEAPYAVICNDGGERLGGVFRRNYKTETRKCRVHGSSVRLERVL